VLKNPTRVALRILLALAGILVIVWIVWKTGWTGVRANLLAIGPWFPALLVLNLIFQGGFVAGLRYVLEPLPRWRDLPRLYAIYLMGDAANYIVPGGGEAAKTHFLRKIGGGEAAVAAVALHKHADLVAQTTFAFISVTTALIAFDLPRAFAAAAILGTLALLILLLLMTWALGRGAFSPILRRLLNWKFLAERLHRFQSGAAAVDARIVRFHSVHRGRFLAASFFNLVGYCGGLVETWIVLKLLAPSAGWATRLAVEGLPMVLNNAILFIPGKLGGAEGIRTAVCLLVGLTAAQGAAYSLLRRTREVCWVLPGWVLLVRDRLRGDHPLAREEEVGKEAPAR
jgi:glycosyltransferase 2 family protein